MGRLRDRVIENPTSAILSNYQIKSLRGRVTIVCSGLLRVEADDLGIQDAGEGDPGGVGQESVGCAAVDFVSGSDVGKDRALEAENVGEGERGPVLSEKLFGPLCVRREL